MSDDSHGTVQVGTNYPRLLEFIKKAGIKQIWYADRKASKGIGQGFGVGFSSITVEDLAQHPFWTTS